MPRPDANKHILVVKHKCQDSNKLSRLNLLQPNKQRYYGGYFLEEEAQQHNVQNTRQAHKARAYATPCICRKRAEIQCITESTE